MLVSFPHSATPLTSTQLDTASPIDSHRWDCIQNHRSTCERNMCLSRRRTPLPRRGQSCQLDEPAVERKLFYHIVGLRLCDDIGSPDVFLGKRVPVNLARQGDWPKGLANMVARKSPFAHWWSLTYIAFTIRECCDLACLEAASLKREKDATSQPYRRIHIKKPLRFSPNTIIQAVCVSYRLSIT